jgi:hypothetical protein
MKEVTLKIPEKKLEFFLELVKQLGFEVADKVEVPEEHQAIVRERMKTANEEDIIPWTEARKQFTFKTRS